jgi:putative transcriptional regulator
VTGKGACEDGRLCAPDARLYNACMSDHDFGEPKKRRSSGAFDADVDPIIADMTGIAVPLSLANHFLIATPGMADTRFSETVVYLLEHTPERAMGVVINRPTELTLEKLFERVDMKLEIALLGAQPVCYGGPMATDRGFVLHDQHDVEYGSTLTATGDDGLGLALTTSKDVLEAIADGRGPKHVMVALGYASWEAGQLESEIALNAWLTVKADPSVIFDVPHARRRASAMHLLGFDPIMLSGDVGHA